MYVIGYEMILLILKRLQAAYYLKNLGEVKFGLCYLIFLNFSKSTTLKFLPSASTIP